MDIYTQRVVGGLESLYVIVQNAENRNNILLFIMIGIKAFLIAFYTVLFTVKIYKDGI